MNTLQRIGLLPLLVLLVLMGNVATAADGDEDWAPTPPRLSFIDGEVSYWRTGADEWARARPNLALAEGDAFYAGAGSNFEVQFGSRSFVRADAYTQLSLLQQDAQRIQFKLASGRVSFDMRSLAVGNAVEVSTPNAVFIIEHPGYYRVEVNSGDTHFITRRGGEATVITADGRSLGIYPSEDIVVTAGNPARVATYAAPAPDAWDRWNDARSDRLGESISARYLPPDIYGAEELDHAGRWRVVPSYGAVWIPHGVSAGWAPYSTGYWVWDPYYQWTWIDDAPWGWAPFHYGRWVYIDGFWAWAPGPVVRRSVYSPALVAFMVRGQDVSVRISVGLPGVWWVALSWGEPVLPWWGPPARRWQPYWGGWAGPRVVNNVVIQQTTVINVTNIRYHNASQPRAVLTLPADRFGRERVQATTETRYRPAEFVPVRNELPVKPSRASLSGGAPKGIEPPREIVTRPVVTTRVPRERAPALQDTAPRVRTQAIPEPRYVLPPTQRAGDARAVSRPPFGADAGPERVPAPRPPRYEDVKKTVPPPAAQSSPPSVREQPTVRRPPAAREQPDVRQPPAPSVARPSAAPAPRPTVPDGTPAARTRTEAAPSRDVVRQDARERPLPGQPASQIYRGRDRDSRDAR